MASAASSSGCPAGVARTPTCWPSPCVRSVATGSTRSSKRRWTITRFAWSPTAPGLRSTPTAFAGPSRNSPGDRCGWTCLPKTASCLRRGASCTAWFVSWKREGTAVATVLLAWELGDGLSHVWPLRVVARGLAAEGHQPVFAVRNLADTGPLFADEPFPVLQAPVWHPRRWRPSRPFVAASFADVLAINGYDHADNLLPRVLAWQRLLDLVRPRLVVSEYSPTLCLAAHGTLPQVLIGSWFPLPPSDGASFPPLTPGQEPVLPQEQVLAVVQEVQRRRGRCPLPTLPALLGGDRFVWVLPEMA